METGLHEVPERVDSDVGVPLSQRIRQRLRRAGVRFHANDNIADYLCEGEVDGLQAEVAEQLEHMLRSLVIDVDADHNTRDTAKRLARMFLREVFSGRYEPAPAVTEFPNVEHLDELMIVGPLRVRSACSHHLCPIMGRVWIGVMPNECSNLIGLSKYGRLVNWVMSRPQIQEEAVKSPTCLRTGLCRTAWRWFLKQIISACTGAARGTTVQRWSIA